jgi:membrane-associated phospholipid phosphatase
VRAGGHDEDFVVTYGIAMGYQGDLKGFASITRRLRRGNRGRTLVQQRVLHVYRRQWTAPLSLAAWRRVRVHPTLMQNDVIISIAITALIVVALFLGVCSLFSHGRLATALLVAGLLTALTGLAIGVHTHGWVTGFDAGTTSWFIAHRSHGFDVAASVIADLGSPAATAATGLICAALLSWRARSVIPGVVVIGTVGAAALAETALKAVVERHRSPAEAAITWIIGSDSFPSGHVTGTAAVLGIIAVSVGMARSRTVRAWLAGSAVGGVLIVAVSRLYFCVHWLTDVIGGALLGAVFVTLSAAVFGALHARSGQEGNDTPGDRTQPVKAHR